MNKVKVAVVDTGIIPTSNAAKCVTKSYALDKSEGVTQVIKSTLIDLIGHGTAVSQIIYETNPNVEIFSFRICDDNMYVEDTDLIYVLEYIRDNIEVDIINISAGITFLYKYKELHKVCKELYMKNTFIVAAFDNDGAISYPAFFDDVIGVDVTNEYTNREDIIVNRSGSIDVLIPDRFYRIQYGENMTIIKGTSFSTAKITGVISLHFQKNKISNKHYVLSSIATQCIKTRHSKLISSPPFFIDKAIVFPVNKETHSLLRFQDLLSFELVDVYDERVSGMVGNSLFGKTVLSYDNIDWEKDFDTVIVSCSDQLTKITHKRYLNEIINKAQKYHKNLYLFERPSADVNVNFNFKKKHMYFPYLSKEMVPYQNNYKLHQITIPIIGVLGTSSKQGKFTLQLELIRRLQKIGYNTAHISTEPSGYLFGADFVFHYGYGAKLPIEPWQCTAILNQMIWECQIKEKDILIVGGQSGLIPYSNNLIEKFHSYQFSTLVGFRPDYSVLCVNAHDDLDYISKTMDYIQALTDCAVKALVVFPKKAISTRSGVSYKLCDMEDAEQNDIKLSLENRFCVPTYLLSNKEDIDKLCEAIINYFAEDS